MTIGIPREILENEYRVAALPETVAKYSRMGFRVLVESSAGKGAYRSDQEYASAGAEIAPSPEALYSEAVLRVGSHPEGEAAVFQPGDR